MRKPIIAVIGDSTCGPDIANLAQAVGEGIAQKGALLICGGYGGVMEAAAQGARKAGGTTIGVLSGKDHEGVPEAIQIPIVTGMRDARNVIIIRSADGVIAVGGGFGTLSEIGFALKFKVPLVGLKTWHLSHENPSKIPSFPCVTTPEEALALIFSRLK